MLIFYKGKTRKHFSFLSHLPVQIMLGPFPCIFRFSGSSTCSKWGIPAGFRNGYPARVKIQISLAQLEQGPLGKEQTWKWQGKNEGGGKAGDIDELKLDGDKNIKDRKQRHGEALISSVPKNMKTYHSPEKCKEIGRTKVSSAPPLGGEASSHRKESGQDGIANSYSWDCAGKPQPLFPSFLPIYSLLFPRRSDGGSPYSIRKRLPHGLTQPWPGVPSYSNDRHL